MIALICLLVPPLVLVLVREKVHNGTIKIGKAALTYPLWALLLNGLMVLILYLFFDNYGQLFAKLNRSRVFACKYFALSLALALAEPWAKKLVKKAYDAVKPFLKRAISAAKPVLQKIWGAAHKQVRAVAFLVVLAIVFSFGNYIAQPIWTSANNYNSLNGFYDEPENTIETIFIGTSHAVYGIIPIELYENYGICAYNLGTVQQPMLVSYYWAEEAYRLHSETLTTIVLDISKLTTDSDEVSFFHRAIDYMELSEVKLRAVWEYSELFGEEAFINLFPLLCYHDRWEELAEDDITRAGTEIDTSTRGYYFTTEKRIDNVDYETVRRPYGTVDEDADEAALNTESLYYLKKLITFCEEHDIQLVLTEATTSGWSSAYHNAVQNIADEYGLDFIDFCFDPYFSELEMNFAYDFIDSHMNYYGATKYTNWLGNYLITKCGNRDVRGDETYSFMEEELEEYHRLTAQVDLNDITDPAEYISYLLDQGDYTIFLSVKDTAADKLTQEQRDYFASIGLTALSELTNRASYLAVIDDGTVVVERSETDPGVPEVEAAEEENTPINDMEHIEEIFAAEQAEDEAEETEEEAVLTLSYTGTLADGTEYEIVSGGRNLGRTSSILIDGTEYSDNTIGLNIVVYDNQRQEIIDQVCFDTHSSSERETLNYATRLAEIKESDASLNDLSGIDHALYLYDRRVTQLQLAGEIAAETDADDLLTYLAAYWNESGCEICISVKGEAADAMTGDVRDALAELGLTELAALESGDSYLAVVSDGVVIEERDHGDSPLELSLGIYSISSGGVDSGNTSSIMIAGTEYSKRGDGINIVVYDTELEEVLSQVTFATGTVSQRVDD